MAGSHYRIDTQNSYDSLFNSCQTCNSIDCSCDSVLDINSIDTASTGNKETEIHVLQCDADCPSTASHSAKSSDIDNNHENDTIDNVSTDYFYSSTIYDDVQHHNNYLYNNTCPTLSMNSSNSVNVSTSMSAQNLFCLNLAKKGMNMGHLNIQGLQNKLDQLQLMLNSETGPDSSVGRVSAPGTRRSRVRSRAATYQSHKKWYSPGTQTYGVELGLVDPVSG